MSDFGEHNPLISILIANYNNAHYLPQALESIATQTYSNYEVVIVDDGSTDDSEQIYATLSTDKFRVLHHEGKAHCGVAPTKHLAAQQAKGLLCGFLDPDDALLPNALCDTVATMLANPHASIVASRCLMCNEHLVPVAQCRTPQLSTTGGYLENREYFPLNFALFRKKSYDQCGGIDTVLQAAIDSDMYFRLEEVGAIAYCESPTYLYRIHNKSITAAWDKGFYWNLIARHNACMRRGYGIEPYTLLDLRQYVSAMQWRNKAYRIGKLLRHPSLWLQQKRQSKWPSWAEPLSPSTT
ncbi:MAG: glycosyltransferase family 2 protein [Bacteroidales bacterium]|nr:glycosyltransferase family 2 protein [Bacteroidales bacterium]